DLAPLQHAEPGGVGGPLRPGGLRGGLVAPLYERGGAEAVRLQPLLRGALVDHQATDRALAARAAAHAEPALGAAAAAHLRGAARRRRAVLLLRAAPALRGRCRGAAAPRHPPRQGPRPWTPNRVSATDCLRGAVAPAPRLICQGAYARPPTPPAPGASP